MNIEWINERREEDKRRDDEHTKRWSLLSLSFVPLWISLHIIIMKGDHEDNDEMKGEYHEG